MTLDEAIQHAREVAERIQKDANKQKGLNHGYYVWQSVNADKYRQIAEWLEELKELREFKAIYQKEMDYSYATFMYNKAIDDFVKNINECSGCTPKCIEHDISLTVYTLHQIANELKEHKTLNIVHCKDCKYWGTGVAGETENVKCCEYGKYMVGENGYCCYGEKECVE